ncbi:MAG: biopolymer transport protein ExbD [Gammaproteobacteria bacterium]|jgi:biopolymer transport protein ExbD
MNLSPKHKVELELNITPLVDVVFLLLIFFMVSTTFERNSEITITLPKASDAAKEINVDTVSISVDAQEQIFINDIQIINSQLSTIRETLKQYVEGMNEPTIIISADANATHQSVVKIMDAARQLSLTRITFSTQVYEEE